MPGSVNACGSAEDCTTPPNACQLAEGAVCNEGVCEYPDVVCDSPEADRCIEDGAILVRSSLPGTCDPQSGACTYAEEEIAVDPENCERIATGGCDAVVCTDPPCASNGTADPDSPACECEFAILTPADNPCSDPDNIALLCFTASVCDGQGSCVGDGSVVPEGESCIISDGGDGELVEALDDSGRPRRLRGNEERALVPEPFCDAEQRCIECREDTAVEDCDDGNACTDDVCDNGLCKNFTEPQDTLECTLPETDPLFGTVGFCADGDCVQCDSSITDVAARDAACVRRDSTGEVNSCLQGTCEDNMCQFDLEATQGLACNLDSGGDGLCFEGRCVECFDTVQCAEDGNPCTDTVCQNNSCQNLNDDENDCQIRDGTAVDFCVEGNCIPCTAGDTGLDGEPIEAPSSECSELVPQVIGGVPQCLEVAIASKQGEACQDNNACTTLSTCQGGSATSPASCVTVEEVDCTPSDSPDRGCLQGTPQGNTDASCNPATGQCIRRTGGDCNDGDSCTFSDRCQSDGRCASNSPRLNCTSDPGTCGTQRSCVEGQSQCRVTSRDGNACGCSGSCSGGSCTGELECCASNPCERSDEVCFDGECVPDDVIPF
ncbi:MAG: hypothetical protein AAF735_06890 [Myxococcota bacterium]